MTWLKTLLIKEIIDKFKKVIDDKEKEELIQNNLKDIKNYHIYSSFLSFYNSYYYYKNTRDFGNKYKEMFSEV